MEDPTTKKANGRPRSYTINDIAKMAVCAHFKVSSNNIGPMLNYFSLLSTSANRSTIDRAAVEAYLASSYSLAVVMSSSRQLFFGIDGAGAKRRRDFLVIRFGGIDKIGKRWLKTVSWTEVGGETGAAEELRILLHCLQEINTRQEQLQLPLTELWHFRSCVFDTASVNTGEKGGVGRGFMDARDRAWKETYGDITSPPPFYPIGCLDHVADLASKAYTLYLTGSTMKVARLADGLLKKFASRVSLHRPELNTFMQELLGGSHFQVHMESHDEVRFLSLDEISRCIYEQWNALIMWHITSWNSLPSTVYEEFEYLSNPELLHLIRVRATISDAILFPLLTANITTAAEYIKKVEATYQLIHAALQNPHHFLLKYKFSRKIVAKDKSSMVSAFLHYYYINSTHFTTTISKFVTETTSFGIKKVLEIFRTKLVPKIEIILNNRVQALQQQQLRIEEQPQVHAYREPPPTLVQDTPVTLLPSRVPLERDTTALPNTRACFDIYSDNIITNFEPVYIRRYLQSIKEYLDKHIQPTLQKLKAEPNLQIEVTNRTTERVIGQGKRMLFFFQCSIRAILILSRITCSEYQPAEITTALQQYANRFNLRTQANKLLQQQTTRAALEKLIAAKKQKKSKDKDKQLTDMYVLKQLISVWFALTGRLEAGGKTVTITDLQSFLSSQKQDLSKLKKLDDYLLATHPHLLKYLGSLTETLLEPVTPLMQLVSK
jgi:hypothetical protein